LYLGVFPACVRVTVMPKFDNRPRTNSVLQPMRGGVIKRAIWLSLLRMNYVRTSRHRLGCFVFNPNFDVVTLPEIGADLGSLCSDTS
jgi:hypothetical protein